MTCFPHPFFVWLSRSEGTR